MVGCSGTSVRNTTKSKLSFATLRRCGVPNASCCGSGICAMTLRRPCFRLLLQRQALRHCTISLPLVDKVVRCTLGLQIVEPEATTVDFTVIVDSIERSQLDQNCSPLHLTSLQIRPWTRGIAILSSRACRYVQSLHCWHCSRCRLHCEGKGRSLNSRIRDGGVCLPYGHCRQPRESQAR